MSLNEDIQMIDDIKDHKVSEHRISVFNKQAGLTMIQVCKFRVRMHGFLPK
jgi:hypothetical protein